MISPDLPITKFTDDTLKRKTFAESHVGVLLQYPCFPNADISKKFAI